MGRCSGMVNDCHPPCTGGAANAPEEGEALAVEPGIGK